MTHAKRVFPLEIALLVIQIHCAMACAASELLVRENGILVLRNGQVLRGQIWQDGDRFVVVLGEGGEVRLSAHEVERRCRDLEEAYQSKRSTAAPGNAEAHLDLAEWCLRHRLLSACAEQLIEARRLDGQNPRNDSLERRLQLAARGPAPSAPARPSPPPIATAEQLERMTVQLPAGALETFTSTIQPVLLNRCAASGCHGSASQGRFRLLRPPLGRAVTRRLTQRNLFATLQMIDRGCPEESPLLTMPRGPHGDAKSAVFGHRDARQRDQIAAWVRQVTSGASEPQPATIAKPNAALLQTAGSEMIHQGPEPSRRKSAPPAAHGRQGQAHSSSAPPVSPRRDPAQPQQHGSAEARFGPRDPFDPEMFNRRFFPEPASRGK